MPQAFLLALASAVGQAAASRIAPHKGFDVGSRDGCIAYHVHDALKAGASREEVVETVAVAMMMGGGPAAVYAAMAIEALDQFQQSGGSGVPSSIARS